jgi:hypothetical protein
VDTSQFVFESLPLGPSGHSGCWPGSLIAVSKRIICPSFVEVLDKRAFEDCRFIAALEFSSCSCRGEIHGFSGCTVIGEIKIPVCVVEIGRMAFEEDASVREIRGFTRRA